MSSRFDKAFSTIYKKMADQQLPDFWYKQAERIDRDYAEYISKLMLEMVKPEKEGMVQ